MEEDRNHLLKPGILFINADDDFATHMESKRRLMKHLDTSICRVFVATNKRGDTGASLRRLPNVITKEYDLWASIYHRRSFVEKAIHLARSLSLILSFIAILRLIRKENIQLIHCHTAPRILLLAILLAMCSRSKLVVHLHGQIRGTTLQCMVKRLGLRRADAIIAVSDFLKKSAVNQGFNPSKVWPVLNVVDLEKFRPDVDGRSVRREYGIEAHLPVIVLVGRMNSQKGHRYLLEALLQVEKDGTQLQTLLVGWDKWTGASYSRELKQFCTEHGMDGRVIFTGHRSDIPQVFAAADIAVFPTIWDEPFGLVVAEAMAAGKPVIATRSGGITEIVTEDSGILVPKGSPHELAKAIVTLLRSPTLRLKLGRAARRRAEEHFYEARLAEDALEVYRSLGLAFHRG